MLTRLSSPTERIRRDAARSASPRLTGALDENRIASGEEEAGVGSIGRICGRTDASDGWEEEIKGFKQFDETYPCRFGVGFDPEAGRKLRNCSVL
jgi:hypothetical protein